MAIPNPASKRETPASKNWWGKGRRRRPLGAERAFRASPRGARPALRTRARMKHLQSRVSSAIIPAVVLGRTAGPSQVAEQSSP